MEDYKQFIISVLTTASNIANANFGKVSGVTKPEDNNQVLTETDIEIGAKIVQAIQETYPGHNIIDEEAGVVDKGSSLTWVVDPIDGTSNFANGIPTYAVMVGLLDGGTPIAGGVALPGFDHVYVATKGAGAYRNGERILVSDTPNLLQTLVAYGIDGHQEHPQTTKDEVAVLERIILGIRNLRTSNSAFDFMLVADGRYGGNMNRTSKIWDNVAPQIIIEEAGGIFTDFYGQPIDYTNPLQKVDVNFTCCTASPELHRQLQQIIRQVS